mmetsp:Transcript_21810/g.3615  ORF Transcript_21810/g.3615 Transcript_21810/m.3615 type:complete len:123 (-) Transcript_21810:273-641(-)
MRKLNSIIDIEAYYNTNLNRIPEKLKEFFQEVINEEHYSKDELVINGIDLGKHATKHLLVLLPLYGRIAKLKLAGLNLKAEGMRRIASAIGKMQMLKKLELPNNNCGTIGAKALAGALRHNP